MPASAAILKQGQDAFPSRVDVGHHIEYQLDGEKFQLVRSAPGARLSPQGLITWMPTNANVGNCQFEVVATVGGKRWPVKFETDVTGKTATPPVDVATHQVSGNAKLTIIDAKWGEGAAWADVTDEIRAAAGQYVLRYPAKVSLLGAWPGKADPARGSVVTHARSLVIHYSYGGEVGTSTSQDGQLVLLLPQSAPATQPSNAGLQILEARYGGDLRWKDLTESLRSQIKDNRLDIDVDPSVWASERPRTSRVMIVVYLNYGEICARIVPEHRQSRIEAAPGQLQILEAIWETARGKSNVTEQVSMISGRYSLVSALEPRDWGDSPQGTLTVRYRLAGKQRVAKMTQGQMLRILPEPQDAAVIAAGRSGFRVFEARYGNGEHWVDFTERLRERTAGGPVRVVAGQELAGDEVRDNRPPLTTLVLLADGRLQSVVLARKEEISLGETPRNTTVFRPLAFSERATSMELSEDRSTLFIAHEAANKVSVWDVASARVTATLATASPRFLMSRGNKLYIANYSKGTVTVFDRLPRWSATDELLVGPVRPFYLSAPNGEHFHGQIIVSASADKGSVDNVSTWLADTRTDKPVQIVDAAMTVSHVDPAGLYVVTQGRFMGRESGIFSTWDYQGFVESVPAELGGETTAPFLRSARDGRFWFGANQIYAGMPPRPISGDLGGYVIPDANRPTFYVVGNEMLEARALDRSFSKLGQRRITLPADAQRGLEGNPAGYEFATPVAVTLGQTTRILVIAKDSGTVLQAEFPAFAATTQPAVAGVPTAAKAGPGLPARVTSGQPITCQVEQSAAGATYALVSGPKGIQIGTDGRLSWTPTNEDLGPQQIKVRVTRGAEVSFSRLATEVVEIGSIGTGTASGDFPVLELFQEQYRLEGGMDGHSMLLLQGRRLSILDGDGFTLKRTQLLDRYYYRIAERKEYWVALSAKSLDLLDHTTFRIIKSIHLEYPRALDLVIDPTRNVSYVAVKIPKLHPSNRIVIVDEAIGRVTEVEDSVGEWLALDPRGRYLFAGYTDLFDAGADFQLGAVGEMIPLMHYERLDLLIRYNVSADGLHLSQVKQDPGGHGTGVSISPDGARVSYLSHGGRLADSESLPAFDTEDLARQPVNFRFQTDKPMFTSIAYHPMLKWAASLSGASALFFDRESGGILPNRLRLPPQGLAPGLPNALYFSGDGRNVIFECTEPGRPRYLRKVALDLTPAELETVNRGAANPLADAAAASHGPNIQDRNLEALKPGRKQAMTPQDVGRQYMDSIVIVRSDQSSGTGFVVGSDGYILTCAHVLPTRGQITVVYRASRDGKTATISALARALRVDQSQDLALLKIDTSGPLKTVTLSAATKVEAGENITVIGNPGIGDKILDYTLTTGVVSNPQRQLGGNTYVQTSAAVNAGSSGGPMFNGTGEVIGLVVLKANVEAVAFGVPAPQLRQFLRAVLSPTPTQPE